jgi:thiosulfate/3-mercaptopyruvate sulfurtransferase
MTLPPVRLRSTFARVFLAACLALASAVPTLADGVMPLVSVDWLKGHLHDSDLVILDVRSVIDGGGAEAYARGHIPGAVHSDYDKAGWRVSRNGVPFMLPTVPELEKLIGELGIDEDNRVVVVPAGVSATDFGAAARVYWTLKVTGVTKVSILNGGFAAWTSDPANPVDARPTTASPKIFSATIDRSLIAETGDVERVERSGGATLVDARSPALFLGKARAEPAQAYGHIPGAINLDNETLYDARNNRLKSPVELAGIATSVPGGPAISYCNTGHWAATDWFVLSELLGHKDVRLYYGSMADWTSDATRPIASSRTKWDDLKKALGVGP